jgi:hypothetical protein
MDAQEVISAATSRMITMRRPDAKVQLPVRRRYRIEESCSLAASDWHEALRLMPIPILLRVFGHTLLKELMGIQPI